MIKMSDVEIAWCAGLFDGEGSVFQANQNRNGKIYSYARLQIKMTDLDILEKFFSYVKCGTIQYQTEKGKLKLPNHYKQTFYWQLSNRDQIIELLNLFWIHLSQRRKLKILELKLMNWQN